MTDRYNLKFGISISMRHTPVLYPQTFVKIPTLWISGQNFNFIDASDIGTKGIPGRLIR